MVKRKLNKKRVAIAIGILLVLIISIVLIVFLIKDREKKNSIEYKLEEHGYSITDIKYIKKNLSEEEQNNLLSIDYSNIIVPLYKEKYFRKDKFNLYLEYYNKNKGFSADKIVRKVNTHTNVDFYDEILETDISKNELMLVNKYYKLSSDYEPSDIVKIGSSYAYSSKYISNSILESIQNMIDKARESNYKLVVSSGYRSYSEQEKIYDNFKINNGIREADTYVSRPGHSDYQTGYSFDIEPYAKYIENIDECEEYNWLLENMHKFGFIQRFPKGKEDITGFKYSAWHLRYVGVEAATYIHDNDITFEEYYGYKF